MSITDIIVEISCDGENGYLRYFCSAEPHFGWTAKEARAEARDAGWLINGPGGRDYCPKHRKKTRAFNDDKISQGGVSDL